MYANGRRPSEIIAMQRETIAELEGLVDLLKGALSAAGSDEVPDFQPWMKGLSPQERALMGALFRHYPNPVDKYVLLDMLPGRDHVEDRQAQLVSIKVCHLRKKLGDAAIENVRGLGYRLGEAQYRSMVARDPAKVVELRQAA